jgi:hypothetical protein
MEGLSDNRQIPEMELMVLRGVVQLAPGDPQRAAALVLLASYSWRDHDHQIVYEVLRDLRGRYPQPLKEWLAAAVTRKAFPDLDLEPYFVPTALSREQLLLRIRELVAEQS